MDKKQTATKKIKKKKWFPIVAPQILGGRVLGETILTDSILMKGKYISMNLMNIMGDPKKQNTNVQLLIKDVKDGQGITEIVKIERIPSFVKRAIRRGRNKVEDSFIVITGDRKRTRVKTLAITNSYVPKSVCTKLRKATKELLKEAIGKNTFEKTIDEILRIGLLKDIRSKISKISPVRTFDIRVFKIEKKKGEHEEDIPKEVKVEDTESKDSEPQAISEAKPSDDAQKTETKVSEVQAKPKQPEKVSDKPEEPEVIEEKVEEVKEEKKEEKVEDKPKKEEKKPAPKKEAKPKADPKKAPTKKTAVKKAESKKEAKPKAVKKAPAKKK